MTHEEIEAKLRAAGYSDELIAAAKAEAAAVAAQMRPPTDVEPGPVNPAALRVMADAMDEVGGDFSSVKFGTVTSPDTPYIGFAAVTRAGSDEVFRVLVRGDRSPADVLRQILSGRLSARSTSN